MNRKEMKKMKEDIESILGLLTGGRSYQQSKKVMEKQNSSMRSIETLGKKSFSKNNLLKSDTNFIKIIHILTYL